MELEKVRDGFLDKSAEAELLHKKVSEKVGRRRVEVTLAVLLLSDEGELSGGGAAAEGRRGGLAEGRAGQGVHGRGQSQARPSGQHQRGRDLPTEGRGHSGAPVTHTDPSLGWNRSRGSRRTMFVCSFKIFTVFNKIINVFI